jgi:hypothetical protein
MKNELICRPVIFAGNGPIFNSNIKGLSLRQMATQCNMHQHLYLVSDREIKEGDWVLATDENHVRVIAPFQFGFKQGEQKVEATTDKSLGLPLIPQSFIEEYVQKQGKIDKVKIQMENWEPKIQSILGPQQDNEYLPKSEQEVIILPIKDSWNREEVRHIAMKAWGVGFVYGKDKEFGEWFDKNYPDGR